jgi:hypothetical protein
LLIAYIATFKPKCRASKSLAKGTLRRGTFLAGKAESAVAHKGKIFFGHHKPCGYAGQPHNRRSIGIQDVSFGLKMPMNRTKLLIWTRR